MELFFVRRIRGTTAISLEVCPYKDSSLGYRDPYVGILVPTRDPIPEGTLGNLVLHRNM
jgi:hypothetical protein